MSESIADNRLGTVGLTPANEGLNPQGEPAPTRAAADPAIRRAVARALRGDQLNVAEVTALVGARHGDLDQVRAAARQMRQRSLAHLGRDGIVTYSPKVFIPLTRLCRDRCHYCTFVTDPAALRRGGHAPYLGLDEVEAIARAGAAQGCTEALFTLGDRPEERWPAARQWLAEAGYASTLEYLRAAAVRVLETTGLLPHLNPGVMSWQEMQRLRPVAPSMGMMLETSARRLFTEPGAVHYGSPDKDPQVRLRVISEAGRLQIPFTTGLLVGIGETLAERAQDLLELRAQARRYGHIQEVIIQNFRAKPDTAMRHVDDLPLPDYLAAVAAARLVLGPQVSIQAPPNLTDEEHLRALLDSGIDDWGGISPVTPDHVNPERPWPLVESLAAAAAAAGFTLQPRLTAHPRFIQDAARWVDPRLHRHVLALADERGLAATQVRPSGIPWQEADGYGVFAAEAAGGRTDLAATIDSEGRRAQLRGDVEDVFGDWDTIREDATRISPAPPPVVPRLDAEVREALRRAERAPQSLVDHPRQAEALAAAEGPALTVLARLADELRAATVGEEVTYVRNRNINFTNVCYTGCRFCAFAQRESDPDAFTLSLTEVGDRVDEAVTAGATEICMQGGIHPRMPGQAYFDLAREVTARPVHLHAFSPMEIVNGASRTGLSVRDWLLAAKEAGLGSIPGTAAEILDDDVRWILTKGKLPTRDWLEVVDTAHDVGLPSSATMMYGHVDAPRHWVTHLTTLYRQQQRSGGFTEFVGLPFVHHNAPLYLAGAARPGPTPRDDIAVIALARLMLHGAIDNIQVSWVKLGPEVSARLLRSGANDVGGTLMEETISRMAGSEFGSAASVAQLQAIATAAGRPSRERTTLYGSVPQR